MNDPLEILTIIDKKMKEAAKLVQECKDLADENDLQFAFPQEFLEFTDYYPDQEWQSSQTCW